MSHKVYINGKMVDEKDAVISIFDRSYLYGEGVFETMRAYKGRVAFCDMHYHRLKANCEKLNIELPLDEYSFEKAINKTVHTNNVHEAYVRVTVSPVGASIGLARPQKIKTNLVIFATHFKEKPKEIYEKGIRVVVVESVYADDPEIAQIKSTNYLTRMLAREEVSGKKAEEGIMQNRDGFVLEGTASNLFIVTKKKILTPPLSDGCLPGVTRWVVMGLAEELNIPCKETHLTLEELAMADEIFLTGSTSEVTPVRDVVGLTRKSAPGLITAQIMKAYRGIIESL